MKFEAEYNGKSENSSIVKHFKTLNHFRIMLFAMNFIQRIQHSPSKIKTVQCSYIRRIRLIESHDFQIECLERVNYMKKSLQVTFDVMQRSDSSKS